MLFQECINSLNGREKPLLHVPEGMRSPGHDLELMGNSVLAEAGTKLFMTNTRTITLPVNEEHRGSMFANVSER